jgi:glycosyltransferase involved in cell wall biosynthesis
MTFELARQWVERGHQVTVYTSDQQDERRRFSGPEDSLDGITIRRFRNPVNALATRYPFLFHYPAGIARALQSVKGQFDIAHIAEARGPHNRWAAKYLPLQGTPFVWSAYGGLAEGRGARQTYRKWHDRLFDTGSMVQTADGLIAQTVHEAEVYRRFGASPSRIRLIRLAVNFSEFEQLPARGGFRRRLGIGEREKLVLFLGRIHRTKGLPLLIPAFADVVRRMPEARLAVAGWDHGFLSKARHLSSQFGLGDKVLFSGPVYGADRLTAYVDADVFALTPDVFEETSLAALEACACGTPCVVTGQCEIPGLDEAEAGSTVNYDRAQVARALIENLEGDSSAKRGANARRMVRERFSITAVAAEHEQFFKEICEA